jgi:hypothetical protein
MMDGSKLGALWVSQLRQTVTERRNRCAENLLTLNPDGDYAKHHYMLIAAADAMLAAPVAAPAPSNVLNDALMCCCKSLPDGYSLAIHVECGYIGVTWYSPKGDEFVIEGEGYLSNDVTEAYEAAVAASIAADFASDAMLTEKEQPCANT